MTWRSRVEAPLVDELLNEPEPVASYFERIIRQGFYHPNADCRCGLLYLDADVIVVGIDNQAEGVVVRSRLAVPDSIRNHLADGESSIIGSATQHRRRNRIVQG